MTDHKTCEQRIDEHMSDRLNDLFPEPEDMTIEEILKILDDNNIDYDDDKDDDEDDRHRNLSQFLTDGLRDQALESVLCVDKRIVYDICLSTGGPADGFRLVSDGEDWVNGEYYFKDWHDGASRNLDISTVEMIAEFYGIYANDKE